ncbi:MAG: phosphoribosylglycinamide formyltransferase [Bacteroidota bacterium]
MKHIAILASGSGTNALNIINYFKNSDKARVALVISNKSKAGVIEKAMLADVPVMLLTGRNHFEDKRLSGFLLRQKIDLVVLAGFLLLVPPHLVAAFPNRIINIHPALLPKYGGKGMYGMKVHEAVIANKEKESGITIHYVNEKYDEGQVIFQARCPVEAGDTPETLAQKVHQLEYEHFPKVIEKLLAT